MMRMSRLLPVLAVLAFSGCSGRGNPDIDHMPDCSVCTLEIRNQGSVGMDILLDDLSAGPVIATLAPGGIQQVQVERRPRRLYGVYHRGYQRYVRGCAFTGMSGDTYRYTCR